MRPSLAGVFAASALLIQSTQAQCADKSIEEVVQAFGCGDSHTIEKCLSKASPMENFVEPCLLSLGCPLEQIRDGEYWMQEDCSEEAYPGIREAQLQLQKQKPLGQEPRRTTASPAFTSATATTRISGVLSTASSSASISTIPITSAAFPEITGLPLAPRQVSNLICLVTSQSSFTFCATTTGSKTCTPTTTPIVRCADGLICQTQSAGSVICMKADNTLTTSGLVVTIVFGVIVASMIGSLLYMCISARKASNLAKQRRDSQFINASKLAAHSEANLPLMQQQGPAGGQQGTFEDFSERPGAHRVPSSNYGDVVGGSRGIPPVPKVPKLHPGLVSTPGGSFEGNETGYQGARR